MTSRNGRVREAAPGWRFFYLGRPRLGATPPRALMTGSDEQVFRISDLSAHVTELAQGRDEAGSVTYSTTSAQLSDASRVNPRDQRAWSISYSTSKPTMTERGIEQRN